MSRAMTDEQYLAFDPFFGEEGEMSLRRVLIRKARKPHPCFMSEAFGAEKHVINPGDRYREERALVDGDYFGRYCICLPCIDKELAVEDEDDAS